MLSTLRLADAAILRAEAVDELHYASMMPCCHEKLAGAADTMPRQAAMPLSSFSRFLSASHAEMLAITL
jgi:hypothetical protein